MNGSKTNTAMAHCDRRTEEQHYIAMALKGDQQAFGILYHRYYNQIYSFCSRLLYGKHEVEDAVQQVFLEAWRSLGRFEGRSMFSTWLTKIAIHTCLSFHRKWRKVSLVVTQDKGNRDNEKEVAWNNSIESPYEFACLNARKKIVKKLLGRMTKKKQVVFVLSDMQGMTAPEISALLGIPDATVRTRLFHARKEFSCWVGRNASYKELLA